MTKDELKVEEGTVYHVVWDDCCAGGEFVSKLVAIITDGEESEEFVDKLDFENGVSLTSSLWGYTFEESENV